MRIRPENPLEFIREEIGCTITKRYEVEILERKVKALKNENADLKAKMTTNDTAPIQKHPENALPETPQPAEIQPVEIQEVEIKAEPLYPVETTQSPIGDENGVSNDDGTFYDASDVTIVEQTPITVIIDDDSGDSDEPAECNPNATTTVEPDCLTPISEEAEIDGSRDASETQNGSVISPPAEFEDENPAAVAVTDRSLDASLNDSGLAPDSKNCSEISEGREERVLTFIKELSSKQKLFRAGTQYDMDNVASKMKCNNKEFGAEMAKMDHRGSTVIAEIKTALDIQSEVKISEDVKIAIQSEVVDSSTDPSVDANNQDLEQSYEHIPIPANNQDMEQSHEHKPIPMEQLRVPPTPAKRLIQHDFLPSNNSTPLKVSFQKAEPIQHMSMDLEMDFLLSKASNTAVSEISAESLEAQID